MQKKLHVFLFSLFTLVFIGGELGAENIEEIKIINQGLSKGLQNRNWSELGDEICAAIELAKKISSKSLDHTSKIEMFNSMPTELGAFMRLFLQTFARGKSESSGVELGQKLILAYATSYFFQSKFENNENFPIQAHARILSELLFVFKYFDKQISETIKLVINDFCEKWLLPFYKELFCDREWTLLNCSDSTGFFLQIAIASPILWQNSKFISFITSFFTKQHFSHIVFSHDFLYCFVKNGIQNRNKIHTTEGVCSKFDLLFYKLTDLFINDEEGYERLSHDNKVEFVDTLMRSMNQQPFFEDFCSQETKALGIVVAEDRRMGFLSSVGLSICSSMVRFLALRSSSEQAYQATLSEFAMMSESDLTG